MMKYRIAALVAIVLLLSWSADHYHAKVLAWRTTAHQLLKVARQQAATITDMNQCQQRLAALNKTHSETLNDAKKYDCCSQA